MSKPMEVQDAVASTLATPFAQPIIAASKSKAQKQREYRHRIAASRTPAQAAAARKSKNERQRKNRLRYNNERVTEYRERQKLLKAANSSADNQQSEIIVKSYAQRQKKYREKKKIQNQLQNPKKKPKTNAQRQQKFRENQKEKVHQNETINHARVTKKIQTPAQRSRNYRQRRKRQADKSITDSQQREWDVHTEILHNDQCKSIKVENNCLEIKVKNEQCEWPSIEEAGPSLQYPTDQFSAADPLEILVKVEPELEMETTVDDTAIDAVPAEVELVEVPDSAVDSYSNTYIEIASVEFEQPDLPPPVQSASGTNDLKVRSQPVLKYTGRDKFDIFSEFLASKLRDLRSADRKVNIMNGIIDLIDKYYE